MHQLARSKNVYSPSLKRVTKQIVFTLCFLFSFRVDAAGWLGLDVFSGDTLGIGFSGGSLVPQAIGWYGGLKTSGLAIKDSSVSYPVAKTVFNDQEKGTYHVGSSLHAGATYQFNENFAIAAGLGFESTKEMVEFYDAFQILGEKGKYYVEKDTGSSVVYEARALFRPSMENNFSIGFGYQSGFAGGFLSINYQN